MIFRSRRAVIFRHGCFWHRHADCALARMPKSRASFWCEKLEANRVRDRRNQLKLNEVGWDGVCWSSGSASWPTRTVPHDMCGTS